MVKGNRPASDADHSHVHLLKISRDTSAILARKKAPSIRVLQISPPTLVRTDIEGFRSIVQRLTGNGWHSDMAESRNDKVAGDSLVDNTPSCSVGERLGSVRSQNNPSAGSVHSGSCGRHPGFSNNDCPFYHGDGDDDSAEEVIEVVSAPKMLGFVDSYISPPVLKTTQATSYPRSCEESITLADLDVCELGLFAKLTSEREYSMYKLSQVTDSEDAFTSSLLVGDGIGPL